MEDRGIVKNDIPILSGERKEIESRSEWHRRLIRALSDHYDVLPNPYEAIYRVINGRGREDEKIPFLGMGYIKTLWDSDQYWILCEIIAQLHYLGKRYFDGRQLFRPSSEDIERLRALAKERARELNPELGNNQKNDISMEKKVIKLDGGQLREMIANAVKATVSESRYDMLGSGLEDYQGTGSEESGERMKKIRSKRNGASFADASTRHPGNMYRKDGKLAFNDSAWDNTKKSFGGDKAKSYVESFDELVKPLWEKIRDMGDTEAKDRLIELYNMFQRKYEEWAMKYRKQK